VHRRPVELKPLLPTELSNSNLPVLIRRKLAEANAAMHFPEPRYRETLQTCSAEIRWSKVGVLQGKPNKSAFRKDISKKR